MFYQQGPGEEHRVKLNVKGKRLQQNLPASVSTNPAAEGGPGNVPPALSSSLEAEWFAVCGVRTLAWKSEQEKDVSPGTEGRCPGRMGEQSPRPGLLPESTVAFHVASG